MNKELFAFWRYDLFPYVLGGKIVDVSPKGLVAIEGYGYGSWFRTFKIVPFEEGG